MKDNPLVGRHIDCPICKRQVAVKVCTSNYAGAEIEDHAFPGTAFQVRCPMSWSPIMPRVS